MTDNTTTPEVRMKQAEAQRRTANKRTAAADIENERLRVEIRKLRMANQMLQNYFENTSSQAAYRRRYEKLVDSVNLIRQLASTELNGLPVVALPETIKPYLPPTWAATRGASDD